MARVGVIEPWYGGSHRAWLDAWASRSRHEVVKITHPAEFWRWRLRGSALTLAVDLERRHDESPLDALVISSLVDAAALLGLSRKRLGQIPAAMYLHESQGLYPAVPGRRADDGPALTNWMSIAACDALWFNSNFHLDAVAEMLPTLLERQPPPHHTPHVDMVLERATVLYPGAETAKLIAGSRSERSGTPRVLWNQRWDHDKKPHAVFRALRDVAEQGVEFDLVLAGECQRPDDFDLDDDYPQLRDRIVHRGWLDRPAYLHALLDADVVISAADHEFFGIAIVEAIAAGAVPVLPNRLSFPELVGAEHGPTVLYPDGGLGAAVRRCLTTWPAALEASAGLRESMRRFDVGVVAKAHDDAVDRLIDISAG